MLLLSYPDYQSQAEQLAKALNIQLALIQTHTFPDGESCIQLPEQLPEHILIIRGLDHPNQKLIELLLTCHTARAMGVKRISLISPYLCYMRQDIAFHPGESVSQKAVGELIATLVDDLITVDPHLHRTPTLQQAMPAKQAITLTATAAIAEFIRTQKMTPLLLGPDSESRQWVEQIAKLTGLEFGVASKQRLGDRQVEITLPEMDYQGREILLVDDMISTGQTLIKITRQLQAKGAGTINAVATHPLFSDDAYAQLTQSGISNVWSSDSVTHESNRIALTDVLAKAVKEHLI